MAKSDGRGDDRRFGQIEDDIARTRADIGGTIDALGAKFSSPGRIFDEVVQATGAADKAGSRVGDLARRIRDNPLPTVLIGAGILWLALGGRRGGADAEDTDGDDRDAAPSYRAATNTAASSDATRGHVAPVGGPAAGEVGRGGNGGVAVYRRDATSRALRADDVDVSATTPDALSETSRRP